MQHLLFAFVLTAVFAALGTSAYARPNVQLHLTGAIVGHDANGKETIQPISGDTELKTGEVVRYDVVATNAGTDPAIKLTPVDKIPAGTQYEAGTAASSPALTIEFSIDGGKTFAKVPMISIKTPKGVVEKKADPATYTAIRWITQKPLAPKASVTYSYEVRVK
jgi:uncharacterized repeat protein (TIGR01451 family)